QTGGDPGRLRCQLLSPHWARPEMRGCGCDIDSPSMSVIALRSETLTHTALCGLCHTSYGRTATSLGIAEPLQPAAFETCSSASPPPSHQMVPCEVSEEGYQCLLRAPFSSAVLSSCCC